MITTNYLIQLVLNFHLNFRVRNHVKQGPQKRFCRGVNSGNKYEQGSTYEWVIMNDIFMLIVFLFCAFNFIKKNIYDVINIAFLKGVLVIIYNFSDDFL